TDPNYWSAHMRQTVLFSECLTQLSETKNAVLLEVGPGRILGTFARQHARKDLRPAIVRTLRGADDEQSDAAVLMEALGSLWSAGVELDWFAFNSRETLRRVPLPTY